MTVEVLSVESQNAGGTLMRLDSSTKVELVRTY